MHVNGVPVRLYLSVQICSFVVEPYREDNGGKVFCKTYFEDIDPSTVIEGQAKNAPEYVHMYTSVMDVYCEYMKTKQRSWFGAMHLQELIVKTNHL